jgi:hypothetical protein
VVEFNIFEFKPNVAKCVTYVNGAAWSKFNHILTHLPRCVFCSWIESSKLCTVERCIQL